MGDILVYLCLLSVSVSQRPPLQTVWGIYWFTSVCSVCPCPRGPLCRQYGGYIGLPLSAQCVRVPEAPSADSMGDILVYLCLLSVSVSQRPPLQTVWGIYWFTSVCSVCPCPRGPLCRQYGGYIGLPLSAQCVRVPEAPSADSMGDILVYLCLLSVSVSQRPPLQTVWGIYWFTSVCSVCPCPRGPLCRQYGGYIGLPLSAQCVRVPEAPFADSMGDILVYQTEAASANTRH